MSILAFQQSSILDINELRDQMEAYVPVKKYHSVLESYLVSSGIYSIADVTPNMLISFYSYVDNNDYFGQALLNLVYQCRMKEFDLLLKEINECPKLSKWVREKIKKFLVVCGVHHLSEIDYDIRKFYVDYLSCTKPKAKVLEYIKGLDNLKLFDNSKNMAMWNLKGPRLPYKEKKLFLFYHPCAEISEKFYYLREKEELLWDFTLPGPEPIKRQIHGMLMELLIQGDNSNEARKALRVKLLALKLLYFFCLDNGIDDINYIDAYEVDAFEKALDNNELVGTRTKYFIQIVDNIRKYIFLSARETNWDANVWYLERFHFNDARINPSRPIERLSFLEVVNKKNKKLLQEYMKYLIGITDRSIITITQELRYIISFCVFLGEENILDVTPTMADEYIKKLDLKNCAAATFNKNLTVINSLYLYLQTKRYIKKLPFIIEYYLKDTMHFHNNRSVSKNIVKDILQNLFKFPEVERLIFLNLWSLGLRINEVCTIRAGDYFKRNGETWIRAYQNKMRIEKVIPIPEMLYKVMKLYIQKNHIHSNEYVFQNHIGEAYDAGTFCKSFQQRCLEIDGEYMFQSHGFRHTMATTLHAHGVSLQAIRDYLGHRDENMTRQYIDYVPEQIDVVSDDYFENEDDLLDFEDIRR